MLEIYAHLFVYVKNLVISFIHFTICYSGPILENLLIYCMDGRTTSILPSQIRYTSEARLDYAHVRASHRINSGCVALRKQQRCVNEHPDAKIAPTERTKGKIMPVRIYTVICQNGLKLSEIMVVCINLFPIRCAYFNRSTRSSI